MAAGFDTLEGVVERVTFASEDTGFSVLRLGVTGKRDLVTAVAWSPDGRLVAASTGEFNEPGQLSDLCHHDQKRLRPPAPLQVPNTGTRVTRPRACG